MSTPEIERKTKFVRRTTLTPGERRTNFRQIDCDIMDAITSAEAAKVTPHMSRIYLRLLRAPADNWEREGVLRFGGVEREGRWLTAWEQLVKTVGVASATARKAFAWMNEQGIIGYSARKNGVGIRIFLNRAASSIREKTSVDQKNLPISSASGVADRASSDEAPFKEVTKKENLEVDLVPHAKARAEGTLQPIGQVENSRALVDQVVQQIAPQIKASNEREYERTRQWFIDHALPKAIRVAQASAYDILRSQPGGARRGGNVGNAMVGLQRPAAPAVLKRLSESEIATTAEACAAIVYAQSKSIEQVLAELNSTYGGGVLPEDLPKVRMRIEALVSM
jgi:hypothetical protein